MKQKYNNPALSAVEFMFAVMRDPALSIEDRIEAAKQLLDLGYGDLRGERPPAILYRIEDFRSPEADDDSTICAA